MLSNESEIEGGIEDTRDSKVGEGNTNSRKKVNKKMSKSGSAVDPNTNPNLFRLSLPEWLKEQVNSGKHKDVFWINEEEKIFHVPWKHASRNGWNYDDVSLFKAWAVYTKRYRDGIDKARPALWKTNFRCAVNSHNLIIFRKDQGGERKGDRAHRIIQILDFPKKLLCNESDRAQSPTQSEHPRKFVRLTYPNYTPSDAMAEQDQQSKNKARKCEKYLPKPQNCSTCDEVKLQMQTLLEKIIEEESSESDPEVVLIKAKLLEIISSKEHVCSQEFLASIFDDKSAANTQPPESKPNLNDLYNVGKALQTTANTHNDLNPEIVTEEVVEAAQTFVTESGDVYIAIPNNENTEEVKLVLLDKNQVLVKNITQNVTDKNEATIMEESKVDNVAETQPVYFDKDEIAVHKDQVIIDNDHVYFDKGQVIVDEESIDIIKGQEQVITVDQNIDSAVLVKKDTGEYEIKPNISKHNDNIYDLGQGTQDDEDELIKPRD